MNYKMNIYPVTYKDGDIEWCVEFPAVKGCIGVGDTAEEAVRVAFENLEIHLKALKHAGLPIPTDDTASYSGKFALRMSRTLHQQAIQAAEKEGVSLNALINEALSNRVAQV